ncbi:DNA-3-methyladenine glycosylase 1-like [Cydia pomonella]|uniref:DNA-3-methyladenine glycosylase 1-like n=1 Tax=Cydia pomonella TaxID=82600 RepID=UPI002ADD53CD|nr:DNA-3-methyladenine glycosylase 1-like [Cydia pomonella]
MIETKSTETGAEVIRCGWLNQDPIYIAYHDEEWGKPQYDELKLFEMLCLEGQQAGLSWITVLKKRDHYRILFYNFNPHKIAKLGASDVETYLKDPGIIRHKGKLESVINNAKCFLKMKAEGDNFKEFIWSFVNHKPIINNWSTHKEIPTETAHSKAMSKALKAKGFKFIGSTICYAFMQACGLVDDHILNCVSRIKK